MNNDKILESLIFHFEGLALKENIEIIKNDPFENWSAFDMLFLSAKEMELVKHNCSIYLYDDEIKITMSIFITDRLEYLISLAHELGHYFDWKIEYNQDKELYYKSYCHNPYSVELKAWNVAFETIEKENSQFYLNHFIELNKIKDESLKSYVGLVVQSETDMFEF